MASVYGLCGFFIALVVHAATFTSFSLSPNNPLFWILHVGIFPPFIAMVIGLRKWSETTRGPLGFPTSRLRWREILAYLPPWAVTAGAILFAYAMVNFLLSIGHLPARGQVSVGATQILDPEQARYTVRAFSGHWLVFYAVPTLYYLFVPPTALPADSAQEGAL